MADADLTTRARAVLAGLTVVERRDALSEMPWNASSGWEHLAAKMAALGVRYTSNGLSRITPLGRECARLLTEGAVK